MLSKALSNWPLKHWQAWGSWDAPPIPQHGRGRAQRVRIWHLQGWACHCCSESVPAPQAEMRAVHARECWAAAQTTPGLHSSPSILLEWAVTERASSQPFPWPCMVYQKQPEVQEHEESRVASTEVSSAMWEVHLAALHTQDSINTVVWWFTVVWIFCLLIFTTQSPLHLSWFWLGQGYTLQQQCAIGWELYALLVPSIVVTAPYFIAVSSKLIPSWPLIFSSVCLQLSLPALHRRREGAQWSGVF